MREKAIAEYHRLLAEDKSLGAELFAELKNMMSAHLLTYGGRELGVSLRPHFLLRGQYDRLAQSSEAIARAFEKIAAALVADQSLMERVGLSDTERRLALIDPGFPFAAITTRLDAFVYGEGIKFVEYNAENPSSLPDQSGLNQILFKVKALEAFSERYRLRQLDPVEALLKALLATYREWGGRDTPHIAILDWADLPTANEFILLRNYFVSRGVPAIICAPDELEYTGGKLRRGAFRIDVVYKRVIIHEFLARADEAHPLVRAYADRNVCLVNPFRCKIVHKKAAFELLTDETNESWFTSWEREVIRRSVPWTRKFFERKTVYDGQTIDLVEHARKNRAHFILKPNDDYGGHGIFLGKSLGETEWERAIAEALDHADYIIQETVELHKETFPIFDEKEWSLQSMFVDTNPFIFRGHVEGAMVRLSGSPIINVTSGGGETGFFVIEDSIRD